MTTAIKEADSARDRSYLYNTASAMQRQQPDAQKEVWQENDLSGNQ